MPADNIMGPSVSLDIGVNLRTDQSVQDATILANTIQEIRKDYESYVSLLGQTSEILKDQSGTYQTHLDYSRQLLEAEKELRSIRQSSLSSMQDQAAAQERMTQAAHLTTGVSGGGLHGGGLMNQPGNFYGPMGPVNTGFGGLLGGALGLGYGYGAYGGGGSFQETPSMLGVEPERVREGLAGREGKKFLEGAKGTAKEVLLPFLGVEAASMHNRGGGSEGGAESSSDAVVDTGGGMDEYGRPIPGGGEGSTASRTAVQMALMSMVNRLGGKGKLASKLQGISEGEGLLGSIAGSSALLPVLGYGAAGLGAASLAYKTGSDLLQEGQQYTALTGGTGVAGAVGYNIQAGLESWGGLNPLLPYGVAKQILQGGLAQGYQGDLLNQSNQFGDFAYSTFGINPQQSQQMFNTAVAKAGATAEQLSQTLSSLAQTATATGTSFQGLIQNFSTTSQAFQGLGAGAAGQGAAGILSQVFTGQAARIMGDKTGQVNAWLGSSITGNALLARQLGTSVENLPNVLAQLQSSPTGAGQLAQAGYQTMQHLVEQTTGLGVGASVTAERGREYQASLALSSILGTTISPQQALTMEQQFLKPGGFNQILGTIARSTTATPMPPGSTTPMPRQTQAGGRASNSGEDRYASEMQMMAFDPLVEEAFRSGILDTNTKITSKWGGPTETFSQLMKQFNNNPALGELLQSGALEIGGKTLAQLEGRSAQAFIQNNRTQQQVTVGLTPEAKRILQLLDGNNGVSVGNATTNLSADRGSTGRNSVKTHNGSS